MPVILSLVSESSLLQGAFPCVHPSGESPQLCNGDVSHVPHSHCTHHAPLCFLMHSFIHSAFMFVLTFSIMGITLGFADKTGEQEGQDPALLELTVYSREAT